MIEKNEKRIIKKEKMRQFKKENKLRLRYLR